MARDEASAFSLGEMGATESEVQLHDAFWVALATVGEDCLGQEQRRAQWGSCWWRYPGKVVLAWTRYQWRWWDRVGFWVHFKGQAERFAVELDVGCAGRRGPGWFQDFLLQLLGGQSCHMLGWAGVGAEQVWEGRSGVQLWLCQCILSVRCWGGHAE